MQPFQAVVVVVVVCDDIYELICVVIGVVVDIYKKVDLWTFWKDSFHSLVLEVCLFVEFCWIFHDG